MNPFERYKQSDISLPPSDPRDAAIKHLDALCRELIETANETRNASHALYVAETGDDKSAIVAAATKFGMLRERTFSLKNKIEEEHKHYVVDDGMNIYLSHTESGLPIRVHKECKKQIWD